MSAEINEVNKELYLGLVKLLSKKDYSRFSLTQKFQAKGFSSDEIEACLQELEKKKFYQENNYTEMRVKYWLRKGYNFTMILYKAKEERLSLEMSDLKIMAHDLGYDPLEQMKNIFTKRFAAKWERDDLEPLVRQKLEQKILRYFLSKNHSLGDIKQLLQKH